jgi:hypothetical protein
LSKGDWLAIALFYLFFICFLRRARFFGTHAPRDKERERTSRKIGRESTT